MSILAKIRIGIIGVGNAASTFVQLLNLLKKEEVSGILHKELGGYSINDIEIVAAYDIDKSKVGKDLSKAIFAEPNNAVKLTDVPETGVIVEMGELKDPLGPLSKQVITPSSEKPVNLVDSLKEHGVEILVNLISGFAMKSSEYYAEKAAEAGVAFINCTPAIVVNNSDIAKLYKARGIPLVGDDLLSQIGSTALHKSVLELLDERGAKILSSYALDVGGNPETFSSLELRSRNVKRRIKASSIRAATPYDFAIATQSMDYVDFLGDQRDAAIHIEAEFLAGGRISIEIKMRVPDSLNAFNPLVDAIRATKIAMDRKLSGPINEISAYLFKNPPKPMSLREARENFYRFINQ